MNAPITGVVREASCLAIASVVARGISAATVIMLARTLGADGYGAFSIALAFALLVGACADLGVSNTLIRELSRPEAEVGALLWSAFRHRLMLSAVAVTLGVSLAIGLYHGTSILVPAVTLIFGAVLGGTARGLVASYLHARGKIGLLAGVNSVPAILTSAAVLVATLTQASVVGVVACYGAALFLSGALLLGVLAKLVPYSSVRNGTVLEGFAGFAIASLAAVAIGHLATLTLERALSVAEVGAYAAAARFPALLYYLPGAVAAAYYPRLFRAASNGREHATLLSAELRLMLPVSVVPALWLSAFAPNIIESVLGAGWHDASSALRALSWVVVAQAVGVPLADALSTTGRQGLRARVALAGMLAIVPACMFGATKGGVSGAAWSMLSVELLMAVGYGIAYIRSNDFVRTLIAAAPGIAAASAVLFVGAALTTGGLLSALIVGIASAGTFVCVDSDARNLARRRLPARFRASESAAVHPRS